MLCVCQMEYQSRRRDQFVQASWCAETLANITVALCAALM